MTQPLAGDAVVGMAAQGPASAVDTEIKAVRVTAADCNIALSWDTMFDGCPFWPSVPKWLDAAIVSKKVWPHTRGSTDYAQWDVLTAAGNVSAGPGDWIVIDGLRLLHVVPYEISKAILKAHTGAPS